MQPAFSVVLLTILIGVGQGLFLALFTAHSYSLFGLLPEQEGHALYAQGSALALAFLGAGLLASFFHLGQPGRAWRSAAQWRSSWLSREVIVLPVLMAIVFLYGAAQLFEWRPVLVALPSGLLIDATAVLGAAGSLLAIALFVCTGMIYACLRFLREWHSPLTVVNFILLGTASGFTLAATLASFTVPALVGFFAGWAAILTTLGLIGHLAWLSRNARLKPKSSLQTAIGVKHPVIRQTAMGFMGGSFNTREFFHRASPQRLRALNSLSLLGAFVLPALLLASALSGVAPATLVLAFIVQCCGLIAERWLFFARARHPQNLYYQDHAG